MAEEIRKEENTETSVSKETETEKKAGPAETEIQQEKKGSAEPSAGPETKQEQEDRKDPAPKKEEEKKEAPHTERPKLVSVEKPAKQKKPFWKPLLKVIGICAVAAASGFAGAYYGAKTAVNKAVSGVKEDLQDSMAPFSMDPFGNDEMPSMPGFFGNGSSSDDTLEEGSPALGIYVEETSSGLKVSGFTSGSKAEKAGIESGDIIKKLDDEETTSYDEVRSFLKEKEAGDTVTVTVERDGEEKEIKVELIAQQKASSSSRGGAEKPQQKDSKEQKNSDFPSDDASTYQG